MLQEEEEEEEEEDEGGDENVEPKTYDFAVGNNWG